MADEPTRIMKIGDLERKRRDANEKLDRAAFHALQSEVTMLTDRVNFMNEKIDTVIETLKTISEKMGASK